jgi:hypothetical protein
MMSVLIHPPRQRSLLMVTIPEVTNALQRVLSTAADAIARETGFVRRRRKLSGARFVQTLVFGWLANPRASLEELTQTAAGLGVPISPQGLDQRFTPEAAACLDQVLTEAVSTLVVAEPVMIPLLERFTGVYVDDSTTIRLPDALAELWPGCGGSTPTAGLASLKLQVRLELRRGGLAGLALEAGRSQDHASSLQRAPLPAGALRIADLGYFSLEVFGRYTAAGVYWLSRYHQQTALFDGQGQRLDDLPAWLERHGPVIDQAVLLGRQHRLPGRLLARRVPAAVANERRRKLRAEARREGKPLPARKLALCAWTLFVTNVPPALLTLDEALVLGRARWQIELLFKLWKSHGQVDTSRSAQPWRILCEVYAKLVAMVVQHWLLLVGCWHYPDRSLVKTAQTLQKLALVLACALDTPDQLRRTISLLQRCLAAGGRIHHRKAAPPTYHLLLHPAQSTHYPDPLDRPHAASKDRLIA